MYTTCVVVHLLSVVSDIPQHTHTHTPRSTGAEIRESVKMCYLSINMGAFLHIEIKPEEILPYEFQQKIILNNSNMYF